MSIPNNPRYLEQAEASRSNEELIDFYDAWANDYERDSLLYGYHRVLAVFCGMIRRYVELDAGQILDAGSGTGMLGEMMALMGYRNLVAIDMSKGMLEMARRKYVYRELRQMVVGRQMDFSDGTFDAVTAMGVFTAGYHMPPESFRELVRITRLGGHIIFSIRMEMPSYPNFKAVHDSLEKEGKWGLVEATKPFQSLPLENPNAVVEVKAFKVLK